MKVVSQSVGSGLEQALIRVKGVRERESVSSSSQRHMCHSVDRIASGRGERTVHLLGE